MLVGFFIKFLQSNKIFSFLVIVRTLNPFDFHIEAGWKNKSIWSQISLQVTH